MALEITKTVVIKAGTAKVWSFLIDPLLALVLLLR